VKGAGWKNGERLAARGQRAQGAGRRAQGTGHRAKSATVLQYFITWKGRYIFTINPKIIDGLMT